MKFNLDNFSEEEKLALYNWAIEFVLATVVVGMLVLANALFLLKLTFLSIVVAIIAAVFTYLRIAVFNTSAKIKDFKNKIISKSVLFLMESSKIIMFILYLACFFVLNF